MITEHVLLYFSLLVFLMMFTLGISVMEPGASL